MIIADVFEIDTVGFVHTYCQYLSLYDILIWRQTFFCSLLCSHDEKCCCSKHFSAPAFSESLLHCKLCIQGYLNLCILQTCTDYCQHRNFPSAEPCCGMYMHIYNQVSFFATPCLRQSNWMKQCFWIWYQRLDQRGTANGISTTAMSFFKAVAPIGAGYLWVAPVITSFP